MKWVSHFLVLTSGAFLCLVLTTALEISAISNPHSRDEETELREVMGHTGVLQPVNGKTKTHTSKTLICTTL